MGKKRKKYQDAVQGCSHESATIDKKFEKKAMAIINGTPKTKIIDSINKKLDSLETPDLKKIENLIEYICALHRRAKKAKQKRKGGKKEKE